MLSIRTASQENWSGDVELEFSPADAVPVRASEIRQPHERLYGVGRTLLSAAFDLDFDFMFSRAYRAAITLPPLLWVAVFLLVPYAILFCYSFWSVSPSQEIVHSWTLDNYRQLFQVNVYWQTLFRSMWIAARVMIFSLLPRLSSGLLPVVSREDEKNSCTNW